MSIAYTGFPLANVLIFPLASELCQMEIDGGWPMIFYITGKRFLFIFYYFYFDLSTIFYLWRIMFLISNYFYCC